MIKGLLELFAERSILIGKQVEQLQKDQILYSNYAIQRWHKEHIESENYRVCQVGSREWSVIRKGIVTDKVRRVTVKNDGTLECECLLQEEAGLMCRHIQALCCNVPRFAHLLETPMADVWLNSKFIDAFKNFEVIMPSETEVNMVSGDMFRGPLNMPRKVKGRGRPKVKRFKRGEWKKKMRERTGNGATDRRKQCSCCYGVGHIISRCPVRAQFRAKH